MFIILKFNNEWLKVDINSTLNITPKTGSLIAIKGVSVDNDLMIITYKGLTIRLAVNTISILGRATQGVRLINLREDDSIASVARIVKVEEADAEIANEADIDETVEGDIETDTENNEPDDTPDNE